MVTRQDITNIIQDAYGIAKVHGFHDCYHSSAHYMMLVLSEIGEMVEADRKNRRARVHDFQYITSLTTVKPDAVNHYFEKMIKDTMEDEMADVVIRLCDFCGSLDIVPYMADTMVDMSKEFNEFWGDKSVCEQCFFLSAMIVDIQSASYDADDTEMRKCLGSTLSFIFEMANYHGIDLLWHVERKMEYDKTRPALHGKAY